MAFIEATDTKKTFNWDDIDVGNHRLDHSQNFFAKANKIHENEIELFNAKLANVMLDDVELTKTDEFSKRDDYKENILCEQNSITPLKLETPIKSSLPSAEKNKVEIIKTDTKEISLKKSPTPIKKPVVLACWSTQKPVVSKTCTGTIPKFQPHTPKAYTYKDIYESKKKQMEMKVIKEERKQREFHSHPAPNFNALHERLQKRVVVYEITEPITPPTLKRSKEAMNKKLELRKQLLEKEMQKAQKEKIHAHPAKVLHKEPFVPQKTGRIVIPSPFQLHSEKRLKERKLYDIEIQKAMEEKRKKEEEERKKAEEERIRELKKLTIFKARPNPFK